MLFTLLKLIAILLRATLLMSLYTIGYIVGCIIYGIGKILSYV